MPSILKLDTIQENTSGGGVNFSHPVELPNGTAAAPGMSFTSDPDTGLYRIGANTIGIATNGARVGEIGVGYGGFTGNIIQVQSTTKTDTFTYTGNNTTTFVDVTGLSVSITPKYSNSKIYVIANVYGSCGDYGYLRLARDSTAIGIGDAAGSRIRAGGGDLYVPHATSGGGNRPVLGYLMSHLDSPSTTSSIIYKVQALVTRVYVLCINRSTADYDDTLQGRYSSQITVMELQQ